MKRWILFPLLFILAVTVACNLVSGALKAEPASAPTEQVAQPVEPTDAPMPTMTLPPTEGPAEPEVAEPTVPAPTEPAPVESAPAVLPTVSGPSGDFFAETFDGDLSNFTRWITVGDPKKIFGKINNSALRFEMPAMDTYAYLSRNDFEYSDVLVEAAGYLVEGNSDSLAVMCRISETGWDEFRVTTRGQYAGSYEIYRYDKSLVAEKKNPYVNLITAPRINSLDIKTGSGKNTIGLMCQGTELRLFINGVEQTKHGKKIEDTVNKSGMVGVGVIATCNCSSTIDFESLETKKPE